MTRPFDLAAIGAGLTFAEALDRLCEALTADSGAAAVVQAPPGTGKTTLVPPLLANLVPGRVVVTQPRRVAVRSAARRLAELDGSALGERVGWSVRGERHVNAATRVEFVTPGLLVRRLLADPELSGVDAVILDEVHERQLDTDLLLGLLGDVRALRDDLRLVATSATLDAPRFAALLGADTPAPLIDSPVALHPLEVEWAPTSTPRLDDRGVSRGFLEHVARTAERSHARALRADADVDALVFLPGAWEVAHVAGLLRDRVAGTEVLELHGRIEAAEQDRAVAGRAPGDPPRIVVSTGLAESSLTVPGVRLVIDSGLAREPRRDALRGMSGLVTAAASHGAAVQRAGRAARLGPGRVVRCYDARTYAGAPEHVTPQIATSDLTATALTLAAWGTPRGVGLRLPDAPPVAAMDDAEAVLRTLDAIDEDGRITPSGERLAALPVDPRWGRALLESAPHVGAKMAAEVVALASGDLRPDGADLAGLLRVLREGRHPQTRTWRREADRLGRLVSTAGQARRADSGSGVGGGDVLGSVVARAWPERIARLVEGTTYLLAQGTRAGLSPASDLVGAEWLAVCDVTRASGRDAVGTGAVIRSAAALSEESARELAGPLLRAVDVADLRSGKVSGRRVVALGAIELSSTPVRLSRDQGEAAVAEALAIQGLGLLRFSREATALRERLHFLHRRIGEPWPDVGDAALVARWRDWVAPELRRIAEGTPVDRINLGDAVRRLLPWPAAAELGTLAPERLMVPSGNTAAIRYPEVGSDGAPLVEVKLQECFGLAETPQLGGLPVLFHLMSPAGRPLAVTDDLASFWAGPYLGVRAEMRGRYPKHPWPLDPWTAQATRLTKRGR